MELVSPRFRLPERCCDEAAALGHRRRLGAFGGAATTVAGSRRTATDGRAVAGTLFVRRVHRGGERLGGFREIDAIQMLGTLFQQLSCMEVEKHSMFR